MNPTKNPSPLEKHSVRNKILFLDEIKAMLSLALYNGSLYAKPNRVQPRRSCLKRVENFNWKRKLTSLNVRIVYNVPKYNHLTCFSNPLSYNIHTYRIYWYVIGLAKED